MLAFSKHDTVYVSSTQANGAGFIKAFIYVCERARALLTRGVMFTVT